MGERLIDNQVSRFIPQCRRQFFVPAACVAYRPGKSQMDGGSSDRSLGEKSLRGRPKRLGSGLHAEALDGGSKQIQDQYVRVHEGRGSPQPPHLLIICENDRKRPACHAW
jgi:hypothetical protein